MASQKARARSRQAKGSGPAAGSNGARAGTSGQNGTAGQNSTATRAGSGNSRRGGSRTPQSAAVRSGKAGPPSGGQGKAGQPARGRLAGAQARSGSVTAEPLAAGAGARPVAPRWFQLTTLVLSVAGLGVSIYLTIAHYSSSSVLACSDRGVINCAKVTTSPESMVFGVFPVAVLGLAFYVFMVAINSPWAWRLRQPVIWWARLGGIIAGMGFVLYLLYAEIIQIGNICLWCTGVHVITFLLFVLLVFYATLGAGATARDARSR